MDNHVVYWSVFGGPRLGPYLLVALQEIVVKHPCLGHMEKATRNSSPGASPLSPPLEVQVGYPLVNYYSCVWKITIWTWGNQRTFYGHLSSSQTVTRGYGPLEYQAQSSTVKHFSVLLAFGGISADDIREQVDVWNGISQAILGCWRLGPKRLWPARHGNDRCRCHQRWKALESPRHSWRVLMGTWAIDGWFSGKQKQTMIDYLMGCKSVWFIDQLPIGMHIQV